MPRPSRELLRDEIEKALRKRGNLHAAAKNLGCSYRTLCSWMERYEIAKPRKNIAELYDRDWMYRQIVQLGRSQKEVAAELGTTPGNVAYHVRRLELYPRAANQSEASKRWYAKRYPNGRRGAMAANWRGGRGVTVSGYVHLYKPDHPAANRHGQVYEHRLVMEQKIGRYLQPGEVVDHIDRNRSNNAPENLRLHSSRSQHVKDHFSARDQLTALKVGLVAIPRRVFDGVEWLAWSDIEQLLSAA